MCQMKFAMHFFHFSCSASDETADLFDEMFPSRVYC